METAATIDSKYTKADLLKMLKERGDHNYSGKNKPELIAQWLNPALAGARKSPGRPPGTTVAAGAAKPSKGARKGKTGTVNVTVRYDQQGLSGLTGTALKKLAERQQLTGLSGKPKDVVIASLLTKHHPTDYTIAVQSKSGATKSFTVLSSGAGGAMAPVAAATVTQVQVAPMAAPLPPMALPFSGSGKVASLAPLGQMVPPVQFRQ